MRKLFGGKRISTFDSTEAFLNYCQKLLQDSATRLFDNLDSKFAPIVFLIGVDKQNKPADIFIASPSFPMTVDAGSVEKYRDLLNAVEDRKWESSDVKWLLQAFAQGFFGHKLAEYRAHGYEPFVTNEAVPVEDIDVLVGLLLRLDVWNQYPLLPLRRQAVRSLTDAVVKEFFSGSAGMIFRMQNPAHVLHISPPSDLDMLHKAGRNLLFRALYDVIEGRQDGGFSLEAMYRAATLFDDFNQVSMSTLERSEAKGGLLIGKAGHPQVEVSLELQTPVLSSNHRAFRKLIEISDVGLDLLYDDGFLFGFGHIRDSSISADDVHFRVQITGRAQWSLSSGTDTLMVVTSEKPGLPKTASTHFRVDLQSVLKAQFGFIDANKPARLIALVEAARRQTHGTMLVISDHAEEESRRLETQSTRIKPIELTPIIMERITTIDGAVIISTDGICYAMGAILDGIIGEGEGNSARGSRFNSAVKYLTYSEQRGLKCIIVVISEDGMVDILPRLTRTTKK